MTRKSAIRKVPYNDDGSKGPDMTYVVDFYEDNTLVETRQLPNKSIHYANDVAENWENGIIQSKTSSS